MSSCWAVGTEDGDTRRRRFTLTERFADWLVGGDYRRALDLKDRAVQTAATRPLRERP